MIPIEIKPFPGLALICYPDEFDPDMAYQLRERNPTTLEHMQTKAVNVEANLPRKRARARNERSVIIKDEPSTSFSDAKMDTLIRNIERMVDRISITERQLEVINPNYRGQQQPQLRIKQREQWAPEQPPQ